MVVVEAVEEAEKFPSVSGRSLHQRSLHWGWVPPSILKEKRRRRRHHHHSWRR
jgi:hypothetical protein